MKKLLLFSTVLLQSLFSPAQRFEWVTHSAQGNTNSNSIPVAVDAAGNVYTLIVTGASGAIIGSDTFPSLVAGNGGVVVAKFSPAGNFIWGKMVSTTGLFVTGEKVVADNAGSVYASMYFGNSGEVHMTDTVFQPAFQGVIIKMDSNGNFVRAWTGQTGEAARLSCLGTDLYVSYEGTVAKLDSSFNTIWSKSGTPGSLSFIRGDIFVQTNGELIVSAREEFNSVGDIFFGTDTIHFTAGNFNEVAAIKMDTTGQVLWIKTLPVYPDVRAVALDHLGNAYLGMGQVPPAQFIFANDTLNNATDYGGILKWNAAGVPQWAKGLYLISGSGLYLYDFDVNAQEELLVSGHAGSLSFNNDTILSSSPVRNTYLIKLDSAGTFQWYKGTVDVASFATYADGVAVRNGNEYIQAGAPNNAATLQFGCLPYSTTMPSNFITLISENPEVSPVASFTFSVSNDTTYTFTDSSMNATSWHWDFGDGDTSNLQTPSHDFNIGGNYTVILTTYNGPCSSTDTLQIIGVGIHEINATESFLIYPNPSHNILNVECNMQNAELKIYDVMGREVYQQQIRSTFSTSHFQLTSGVYQVKLSSSGRECSRKLLIE